MRRASGLRSLDAPPSFELSRRDFCALACLTLATSCVDGNTRAIETGGLDGSDGTLPPDASTIIPPGDGGVVAGACSGTNIDVGLATSFVANIPKLFASPNYFYVIRDSNGLYALTSKCSHQHVQLNISGTQFHCPAHGADFTFNGAVIDGPTNKVLVHYAMCTLPNGHVGVQTAMQVTAATRLVA